MGLFWNRIFLSGLIVGTMTPVFADGSISGGGGGTLPLNPAGKFAVMEILRWAPAELTMFFNRQYTRSGGWHDDRIFASGRNIFDVIRDTKIAVKMDGPCLTAEGVEVDGSTSGPVANSVCMSANTIGSKLDKYTVHAQTMALLAHEYSHLLGFNEDDAKKLQAAIVFYFNEVREDWYGKLPSFLFIVDSFTNRLEGLRMLSGALARAGTSWDHACLVSRNLLSDHDLIQAEFDKRGLTTATGNHVDLFEQLWTKMLGIKAASCGHSGSGVITDYDAAALEYYKKAFGENLELTTITFDRAFSGATLINDKSPLRMHRIDLPVDAAKEANDLLIQYELMLNHMKTLRTPAELIEF